MSPSLNARRWRMLVPLSSSVPLFQSSASRRSLRPVSTSRTVRSVSSRQSVSLAVISPWCDATISADSPLGSDSRIRRRNCNLGEIPAGKRSSPHSTFQQRHQAHIFKRVTITRQTGYGTASNSNSKEVLRSVCNKTFNTWSSSPPAITGPVVRERPGRGLRPPVPLDSELRESFASGRHGTSHRTGR